jgi:hypothetical protein
MVLALSCASAFAHAQSAPSRAADPHHRTILKVDPGIWQSAPPISAEARDRINQTLRARRAAKLAATGPQKKVNPLLLAAAKAPQPGPAARGLAPAPANPLLKTDASGAVRVSILVTDTSAAALAQLTGLGARISRVNTDAKRLFAAVAPAQLLALAGHPAVRQINPAIGGIVHAGSQLSEGDSALRADLARQRYGIDGTHIKVGVISDGIAHAADSAATGDLPVKANGDPNVQLCPLNDNDGDEGTAMLEIVHDLAPAAALAFCPAFGDNDEQGLADAVTWLANDAFGGAGADVIVDDVGFLTEPYFQDGIIAQAVDAAAKKGVSYFSSAGNSADAHYELPYADTHPGFDAEFGLDLHDWGLAAGGASDVTWNGIVGGGGNFFAAFLEWNDGFGKSANDYDIYIFDINGYEAGNPAGMFPDGENGFAGQDGDDDPLEFAYVINNSAQNLPFLIVVDRFEGDPNKLLELNFNGYFAVNPVYNVAAGSIWGHAAAKGAFAIAATGAVENLDGTPNPDLDAIEYYSSLGPSRIFFDKRSNPAPETRRKPDFTAVDGVSVTGAGGFPNPFFGTSASAPHAAALAALVKDVDPTLKPAEVGAIFRDTARERGTPGFDSTWGYGLLDGLKAARKAGQIGNSPLFWICVPGRRPLQLFTPELLLPLALRLGAEFGKCEAPAHGGSW